MSSMRQEDTQLALLHTQPPVEGQLLGTNWETEMLKPIPFLTSQMSSKCKELQKRLGLDRQHVTGRLETPGKRQALSAQSEAHL